MSSLGADPSAPPLQQHVGREAELKVMAELAEDYLVGEREAVTVVVEARQGMGKVRGGEEGRGGMAERRGEEARQGMGKVCSPL